MQLSKSSSLESLPYSLSEISKSVSESESELSSSEELVKVGIFSSVFESKVKSMGLLKVEPCVASIVCEYCGSSLIKILLSFVNSSVVNKRTSDLYNGVNVSQQSISISDSSPSLAVISPLSVE